MSYNEISEYNGWTNKPTWLFNLYYDPSNDPYWIEYTIDYMEDEDSLREVKFEVADQMKAYYDDLMYESQVNEGSPNVWDELMEFAFAFINWDKIAEHVIEQAQYQLENEV